MEIMEFDDYEINRLAWIFRRASEEDRRMRFSVESDGRIKFKMGEGMWSPPMGRKENA